MQVHSSEDSTNAHQHDQAPVHIVDGGQGNGCMYFRALLRYRTVDSEWGRMGWAGKDSGPMDTPARQRKAKYGAHGLKPAICGLCNWCLEAALGRLSMATQPAPALV